MLLSDLITRRRDQMLERSGQSISAGDKPPLRKALPPFEALRAFDAVARLGGVRKAAQWLDRDHAVISRHLRVIESWTGVHLLERTASGVVLTEDGKKYHKTVAQAMDSIAHATLDLVDRRDQERLQIWCISGFALYWLSGHIGGFEAENRGVDIEMRPTDDSPDFNSYEADIDIRFIAEYEAQAEPLPSLRNEAIARAAIFAVASSEYLAAAAPISSPVDLLSHQLLHESAFTTWAEWLRSYAISDTETLTGPRLWQGHLTLDAARHGRGIALANQLTAGPDIEAGRLIQIGAANPAFQPRFGQYVMIARRDRWNDPMLRRFRQWLGRVIAVELPTLSPHVA